MNMITGAQRIVRLLEAHGVSFVAGIPGGANLPLYDALHDSKAIHHILTRHEQGAGFIAQGIARSTGKTGVCMATSGPGATNILTAIADAYLDSVPLICITGQVPQAMIGTDAFQEVDTYGMSIPITKHNYLIRGADDIDHIICKAFAIANEGRPGPVLIDVPKDVQLTMIPDLPLPIDALNGQPQHSQESSYAEAARMINAAKRPVFYLGGGIITSGASSLARQLAEQCSLPVTTTLMGLGALPAEHPLSLGMIGMHAARSTNMVLEDCDLLIAAGVRFDDRATGKVSEFCPEADVIHMDIDPSEVDKLKRANIALVGDVCDSLARLLPLTTRERRVPWLERIARLKKRYPLYTREDLTPSKPFGIIRRAAEKAGPEAIVVTDVGKHQMWTAQIYPFTYARQFLTSGGLGTMGFGLPAAIGAALANPDKKVICFSGDGSLQMNIQELATAAEQQANLTVIVLNNNSLGLVRQQQGLFFAGNHFASDYLINIDFSAIARGFGIAAFSCESAQDLEEVLEVAIAHKGPSLVNIPIDKDEEVYPMVPPGAANHTMIGGHYADIPN